MKIVIDGVTYVPESPSEPKWGNGAVADNFIDGTVVQLERPPEEWTCGTIDVIRRGAAYKTAAAALKWYRDECIRLKPFEPKKSKSVSRIKELAKQAGIETELYMPIPTKQVCYTDNPEVFKRLIELIIGECANKLTAEGVRYDALGGREVAAQTMDTAAALLKTHFGVE
jgi:hypothetical protein